MEKPEKRKVIVYIAASLDGYIAKPGDDLSFLDPMQMEGEDYGYAEFMETVDTVLVGRKTYEWVCRVAGSYPHKDKTCYVLTRSPRPVEKHAIFYTGSLSALIQQLRSESGKHIYCEGGAQVLQALLRDNLLDEIWLSIVPVVLGSGIRLFDGAYQEHTLELLHAKTYSTGMVQLRYGLKHP
jgi:dihydrofolate reductase